MKKLIIQIILAGIIIFLGYKCYESIKIPQQFKVKIGRASCRERV